MQMSNNPEEFSVIFKGSGLKELEEIAKMYGTSKGEIIVKAIKLLKLTKVKGQGQAFLKESNREISIDTDRF